MAVPLDSKWSLAPIMVKANESFAGKHTDALNFKKGQVLAVFESGYDSSKQVWYHGEIQGGKAGWFPANLVTQAPKEKLFEIKHQDRRHSDAAMIKSTAVSPRSGSSSGSSVQLSTPSTSSEKKDKDKEKKEKKKTGLFSHIWGEGDEKKGSASGSGVATSDAKKDKEKEKEKSQSGFFSSILGAIPTPSSSSTPAISAPTSVSNSSSTEDVLKDANRSSSGTLAPTKKPLSKTPSDALPKRGSTDAPPVSATLNPGARSSTPTRDSPPTVAVTAGAGADGNWQRSGPRRPAPGSMNSALAAPPSLKPPPSSSMSSSPPNPISSTSPSGSATNLLAPPHVSASTSGGVGAAPSAASTISLSIAQPLKIDRPTKALPQRPPGETASRNSGSGVKAEGAAGNRNSVGKALPPVPPPKPTMPAAEEPAAATAPNATPAAVPAGGKTSLGDGQSAAPRPVKQLPPVPDRKASATLRFQKPIDISLDLAPPVLSESARARAMSIVGAPPPTQAPPTPPVSAPSGAAPTSAAPKAAGPKGARALALLSASSPSQARHIADDTSIKRAGLTNMKSDKFWLSSMTLRGMASASATQAKEAPSQPSAGAPKGTTKVGLDTLSAVDKETQLKNELARRWDDFMKTLPKKERRGGHTYKEHTTVEEQQKLERQGNLIIDALQKLQVDKKEGIFKPPPSPRPSGTTEPTAVSTPSVAVPTPPVVTTPPVSTTPDKVSAVAPVPPAPPKAPPKPPELPKATRVNILPSESIETLFSTEKEVVLQARDTVLRWRIETLMPVAKNLFEIETDPPNVFCAKDCYLVFRTPLSKGPLQYLLYYWIGSQASQDKIACAAIRVTQLNQLLGNVAKHQREDEGVESAAFRVLYEPMGGIVIDTENGTESALRIVKPPELAPALYRCLFKPPSQQLLQRLPLSYLFFDHEHVYVLDAGSVIYQWNGRKSHMSSQFFCKDLFAFMNTKERNSKCKLVYFDDGKDITDPEFFAKFSELLSLPSPADLTTHLEAPKKELLSSKLSKKYKRIRKIYKVYLSAESASMQCEPILELEANDPEQSLNFSSLLLDKAVLTPEHAFMLDAGEEFFIWFGRKSSARIRKVTVALAEKLFAASGTDGDEEETAEKTEGKKELIDPTVSRPSYATMYPTLMQEAETALFKSYFKNWAAFTRDISAASAVKGNVSSSKVLQGGNLTEEAFTALTAAEPVEEFPAFPAEGITQLWILSKAGTKNTPLEEWEHGHFFSRNCYIMLVVYNDEADSAQKSVLYFWQGAEAPSRCWSSFLLSLAPLIEDKITAGGHPAPTKIRILQGHESPHFLAQFNNIITVHRGSREQEVLKADRVGLYHSKSVNIQLPETESSEKEKKTDKGCSYVCNMEVERSASSLKSNGLFFLSTPTEVFLWKGSRFRMTADFMAKLTVHILVGKKVTDVSEGAESELFWKKLCGTPPPADEKRRCNAEFYDSAFPHPIRMFKFSNILTTCVAADVPRFHQSDLNPSELDAAVILDSQHSHIYLWSAAAQTEKSRTAATSLANKFLEFAKKKRGIADVKLLNVTEGAEPAEFVAHFHAWYTKEMFKDPYAEREARMLEEMRKQALLAAQQAAEEQKAKAKAEAEQKAKEDEQKAKEEAEKKSTETPHEASPAAETQPSAASASSEPAVPTEATEPNDPAQPSEPTGVAAEKQPTVPTEPKEPSEATTAAMEKEPAQPVEKSQEPTDTGAELAEAKEPPETNQTTEPKADTKEMTESAPATTAEAESNEKEPAAAEAPDSVEAKETAPETSAAETSEPAEARTSDEKVPAAVETKETAEGTQTEPTEVSEPTASVETAPAVVQEETTPEPEKTATEAVQDTKPEETVPTAEGELPAKETAPPAEAEETPKGGDNATAPEEAKTEESKKVHVPEETTEKKDEVEKKETSPSPAPAAAAEAQQKIAAVSSSPQLTKAQKRRQALKKKKLLARKQSSEAVASGTDEEAEDSSASAAADDIDSANSSRGSSPMRETPSPSSSSTSLPSTTAAPSTGSVSKSQRKKMARQGSRLSRMSHGAEDHTEEGRESVDASVGTADDEKSSLASSVDTTATKTEASAEATAEKTEAEEAPKAENAEGEETAASKVEEVEKEVAPKPQRSPREKRIRSETPVQRNPPLVTPAATPEPPQKPHRSASLEVKFVLESLVHVEKVSSAIDCARVLEAAAKYYCAMPPEEGTAAADSLILSFLHTRLSAPPSSEASDAVRQQEHHSLVYWLSASSVLHSLLQTEGDEEKKKTSPLVSLRDGVFVELEKGVVVLESRIRVACATSLLSKFLLPSTREQKKDLVTGITTALSSLHELFLSTPLYDAHIDSLWRHIFRYLCAECLNGLLSSASVGCGVGIELKFVLTRFFAWMNSVSLSSAYRAIFEPLKQMADVLVISKEPLIENSMRHEVCSALSASQIYVLLSKYAPDDFDPESVHESVLSALRFLSQQEVMKASEGKDTASSEPPSFSAIELFAKMSDTEREEEKQKPKKIAMKLRGMEKSHDAVVLPPALAAHGGLEWLPPHQQQKM